MFVKKAMRYYRVWIYSCNLALLVSTLVLLVLSIWIFSDFHMDLFPSIRLYNPSFLYGYIAILLQGGILQAIGCLGAIRMNEKLLNLYWQILVCLLFGDVVVGTIWLFRYNYIQSGLRGELKTRLNNEYVIDDPFQDLWDKIQLEESCCGVDGPYDYNMTTWIADTIESTRLLGIHQLVPISCCIMSSEYKNIPKNYSCIEGYSPDQIHARGCYDPVLQWLQRSADLLSVLGFCVIAFLKLCFVCILKYEIKEMIQKIQVLKGNANEMGSSPLHELEAYLPRPSIQQDSQQTLLTNSPQTTGANCHRHSRTDKELLVASSRMIHYQSCNQTQSFSGGQIIQTTASIGHQTGNKSTNGNNNEIGGICTAKKQSLV